VLGISNTIAKRADGSFASTSIAPAAVSIRYIGADDAYEMSILDLEPGRLKTLGFGGSFNGTGWLRVSSSYNALTKGNSAIEQDVRVTLQRPRGPLNPDVIFTYTSYGSWQDGGVLQTSSATTGHEGLFAYGIPTALGDVPTTGSASYVASVVGKTESNQFSGSSFHSAEVLGSAYLNFDFAGGLLTGHMQPELCPFDCIDLGRYDFTETIYSTGSRSFSGKFATPGSTANSFFEGSFNGPQAAEVMARWSAPYRDPAGNWGTMFGIWVGKKR